MKNKKLYYTVESGIIASIYVVLTFVSSLMGLSHGAIQFRLSEALIFLPAFKSSAILGLTIGCAISNLTSPYGFIDILIGSVATLITSILVYFTRKIKVKGFPVLSPLINALINGFAIALENILLYKTGFSVFIITFFQVFIGVATVGYIIGIPLFASSNKTRILNKK